MWLTSKEIVRHVPDENKLHDIQIVGNSLYVDGKHAMTKKALRITVEAFDRALSGVAASELFEALKM